MTAFVDVQTGGNSTSVGLTKPTGTVDNDYLLTVIGSAVAQTITPPSGWNLRGSYTVAEEFLYVYDKTAASEGASYTWGLTSASNSCYVAAYRGVAFDTIGTFVNSASGTSLVLSGITAQAGVLIAIAGGRQTAPGWSEPGSLPNERVDFNSAGTAANQCVLLADNLANTAGATGSITLTSVGSVKKTGVLLSLAIAAPTLTGVEGAGSVGTVVPDTAKALTGAAGAGAAGTVVPTTSIPLTGVQSTGAVGNLAAIGGNTFVAVTGVASTASPGTVKPVTSIPTTGVASTGAAGTVTPSMTKAITGNAATVSPGSVVPTLSIPLTGVQATGSVGAMVGMTDFVPSRMLMLFG